MKHRGQDYPGHESNRDDNALARRGLRDLIAHN
jgi:hypothetical protein